jgi:hypothetical protein
LVFVPMNKNIYRLIIGFSFIFLWGFLFLIRSQSERSHMGPLLIIIVFCLLVAGVVQVGIVLKATLGKKLDDFIMNGGKLKKKKLVADDEDFSDIVDEDVQFSAVTVEEEKNLREKYRGFSNEQLQNILDAPKGEYIPQAIKIAREENDKRKTAVKKVPICSTCGKPLPRDHDLDRNFYVNSLERAIKQFSGGLYLGTLCQKCGKVECYSCRGGVGLPCSACKGAVSPAYAKFFDG